MGVTLLVGAVTLGACSGGGESSDGGPTTAADPPTTTVPSDARDVTTINGKVPPATMLPLQNVTTMLDTIDAHGDRLLVTMGVRPAGTRVAIHDHHYGGHTCVIKGTITDFVEGKEPMVWPAGTCYYMPPDTLMTATNLGTEDAVLIDTFVQPPNTPTITIREPGWPGS